MTEKYVFISVCLVLAVSSGIVLFFDSEQANISHSSAVNTPDSDKQVDISNRFNETANVRLTVKRDSTGEVVHEGSYTVSPGEDIDEVYNLNESDPDGIESYNVSAVYRGQNKSVPATTNQCYGRTTVEITEDGELYLFYSIC